MKRGTYRDRSGWTAYPNSRWEDPRLDTFDKVIAGWLMSHADGFVAEHISRHEISDRLDIDPARVTKSLKRLAALGIVTMTAGQRGRLVIEPCVEAWEQPLRPDGIPTGDRAENQPVTERKTNRSADLHLPIGEEQGEQHPVRATAARADALFERFWQAYPRKIGKPAAKTKFVAALRTARVEDIAAGLHRWCEHWAARGEPEFIPHPSTWLHQQRWNDTPPPVRGQRGATARPLTRMEQAYQRRTNCTDDEARAWSQHAGELRRGEVIASDVVAEAAGG